ncbi:DUF3307 domain-containing protein [Clostridium sp. UBA5119]|uniref:DUF3307 domain-containing protein n=1 Tax=Clostridium sp. UBA5119 TaxID=1946366 RepID=UPI003216BBDB
MQIKFIVLCLIAHVIGDYYFQDDEMSELKKKKIGGVFKHSVFYSIPFILILFLFEKSYRITGLILLLCLAHLLIDVVKYYSYKGYLKIFHTTCKKNKVKKYIKPWMIYIFDQVVHIILLITVIVCFRGNLYYPIDTLYIVYSILGIDGLTVLKWVLIVLYMHKPANVTFKIIFSGCKPKGNLVTSSNNSVVNNSINSSVANNSSNNGAIIGFLERIIIAMFLYSNQYSAIGFILTAKSIARYNKISEDAEFGEYYLIGTLFSTLFVIVIYNFIF